jgi:DNA-binding CsgD family transcriptional regulator
LERAKTPRVPTGDAKWATRSPQEKRALSLVAEGMTNEEIGLDLGSSTRG